MSMKWVLPLLATVTIGAAAARPADACSTSCWPGHIVPADGAVVPSNLTVVIWRSELPGNEAMVADLSIVRSDAPGTPIPFTATPLDGGVGMLLTLGEPLIEGQRYTVVDANQCAGTSGPRSEFTVGPAAPLPAQLGTLQATAEPQATATVSTSDGGCSVQAELASATVDLVFSAEAAPWRDVLHFETFVDGRRWWTASSVIDPPAPGASWKGRGRDNVYAVCATEGMQRADQGLLEGGHQVELRATLPGTAVALTTAAVAVTLDCGSTPEPPMCTTPPCDPEPPYDESAGCATSGGGSTVWLAFALALVLAATLRRP